MKYIKFLFVTCLGALALSACTEANIVNGVEDVVPQQISNPQVEVINGGAIITYTLPNDPNVEYVMAEFERNGQPTQVKSSIYNNSLTIEGLNTIDPVTVQLYSVNYFERCSEPVPVTFTPLESVVMVTLSDLEADVRAGFGGIYLHWTNEFNTEISIHVMTNEAEDKEATELWEEQEVYFSAVEEGRTFRDYKDQKQYESVPTHFGVYVEDKWGNVSDTLRTVLTPLPEKMLGFEEGGPKLGFRNLPFDFIYDAGSAYVRAQLFDGKHGDNSWNATLSGKPNTNISSTFTIDLNGVYYLSRCMFYARQLAAGGKSHLNPYKSGNVPVVLEFWGNRGETIPNELIEDRGYWLHPATEFEFEHPDAEISNPNFTSEGEWQYLGRFERRRLDLEGYTEAEYFNITDQGEEFMFDDHADPMRYVRVVVLVNGYTGIYPPNSQFQIGELNFWGNEGTMVEE